MDLLALRHQREARERVGVLAADQHAEATQARVAHAQTGAVAVGPRELLPERGHELAVVVEDRAVLADQHVAVPETADAVRGALVEAERHDDAGAARGVGDALQLRPRAADAAGREALEPLVIVDRRDHRRPERERRNVRLGERDQRRTLACGLGDEAARLGHGLLRIEEDRRHVRCRGLEGRILGRHHVPAFFHVVLIQFTVADGSL